jgi:hypothetical protein
MSEDACGSPRKPQFRNRETASANLPVTPGSASEESLTIPMPAESGDVRQLGAVSSYTECWRHVGIERDPIDPPRSLEHDKGVNGS